MQAVIEPSPIRLSGLYHWHRLLSLCCLQLHSLAFYSTVYVCVILFTRGEGEGFGFRSWHSYQALKNSPSEFPAMLIYLLCICFTSFVSRLHCVITSKCFRSLVSLNGSFYVWGLLQHRSCRSKKIKGVMKQEDTGRLRMKITWPSHLWLNLCTIIDCVGATKLFFDFCFLLHAEKKTISRLSHRAASFAHEQTCDTNKRDAFIKITNV